MRVIHICAGLIFGVTLHASLLFDTGPGNTTTSRPQGGAFNGVGTPVTVSTTTNLTNIAMDIMMPNGGNITYMIWDSSDTTLLFSETQALAPTGSLSFVLSTAFSFALVAGQTYNFGVISDATTNGAFTISDFSTSATFTQNGLSSICCNTNYNNFASPTPNGGGGATIALDLYGTQASAPEPGTFAMFGGAALALIGYRRIRRGN